MAKKTLFTFVKKNVNVDFVDRDFEREMKHRLSCFRQFVSRSEKKKQIPLTI